MRITSWVTGLLIEFIWEKQWSMVYSRCSINVSPYYYFLCGQVACGNQRAILIRLQTTNPIASKGAQSWGW